MALVSLVAAVRERLAIIPGITQAPEGVPAQLGDSRMLIVYPLPGAMSPMMHGGASKTGPVWLCADTVIVEFHLKIDETLITEALEITVPMADAIRDAIASEFARTRFSGEAVRLSAINTLAFGELGWGSDFTFGVRFGLELEHAFEASAYPVGGKEVTA